MSSESTTPREVHPGGVTRRIHAFEEEWQQGRRPSLLRHLFPPGHPGRAEAVRELVYCDLVYRVRAGDAVPLVEMYLQAFPEELSSREARLELITAEYTECWLRESGTCRGDYFCRFPDLAADLATLVPRWTCPLCRRETEVADEAGETVTCAYCGRTSPARASPVPVPSTPAAGGIAPGYEIVKKLGEGGMGIVYQAREVTTGRLVALKVMKSPSIDTEQFTRFRTEAEAAARLNHPNIVQILAVGGDTTSPWIAMEYVKGGSLEAHITAHPEARSQSAAIVQKLALAVDYAHRAMVIHRDLKPANVLLTEDHEPKIADFGLAKKLDEAGQTLSNAVLGSPSYMSPEQAAGKVAEVGPLADVYALGGILYQALTGQPPFRGVTIAETLDQVLNREPVPPRRRDASIPQDLETICLKCLQKEPARRYGSAAALAEDLRRFQAGEPILARPVPRWERAWKWTRKHPVMSALLAAIVVLLVGVTAASMFAAAESRAKAETEARARESLESQLYANRIAVAERELTSNQDVNLAGELLERCPAHLRGWEWSYLSRLCDHDQVVLGKFRDPGLWSAAFSPDGTKVATASLDGFVRIFDATSGRLVFKFGGHASGFKAMPVLCLAYSPDGSLIASGSMELDLSELPEKYTWRDILWSAASGDGEILRYLRKSKGVVKVWEAATGREVVTFKNHVGQVTGVAFSPDGRWLASSSINRENTFTVWNPTNGEVRRVVEGHAGTVMQLRYSPDGRLIATAGAEGAVKLWDAETLTEVRTIRAHPALVRDVAFSMDGKRLATAGMEGRLGVWDIATGERLASLPGHNGSALAITFSPDGERIASGGFDNTVRLWDPRSTEQAKITLRGHGETVWSVAFSPDGRKLVSASFDGTARVWDSSPVAESEGPGLFRIKSHADRVNAVAFSPDGKYLATGSWDKTLRVWDAQTGAELRTFSGHESAVWGVAFSPDGKRIASAGWDRGVHVWDVETGKEVARCVGHFAQTHCVAFSPDGKLLASGDWEGAVKVWDPETGKEITTLERATGKQTSLIPGHLFLPVLCIAFSPDGKRLATGGGDRTVTMWDAASGKRLFTCAHEHSVPGLAFSPDGKLLASGGWDQTVRIWDAQTGKKIHTLRGHKDRVHSVAFSPDGLRVASGSDDKTVRMWDVATGEEVMPALRHRGGVWSVAFSPDNRRLAVAAWTASSWVRVWDVSAAASRRDQPGGSPGATRR